MTSKIFELLFLWCFFCLFVCFCCVCFCFFFFFFFFNVCLERERERRETEQESCWNCELKSRVLCFIEPPRHPMNVWLFYTFHLIRVFKHIAMHLMIILLKRKTSKEIIITSSKMNFTLLWGVLRILLWYSFRRITTNKEQIIILLLQSKNLKH